MHRRTLLRGTAALAAATAAMPSIAQVGGPVVRIVFPFGAGGGGDAISRLMAEHLAPALNRSVIVENKTGANGRIGISTVKSAPPDGDTILLTTGPTMSLFPLTFKSLAFDPFTDFEPVAHLADFEFCIAVAKALPIKSLAELVAWAKANPDKATYGVPGNGTIPHFTGLMFSKLAGLDMRRLAYRGGAPAIQDLVGGQIPIVVGTLADALAQHQSGNIRVIATTGEKRSPFVPEVPTAIEQGFKISGSAWYGTWMPKGTPAAAIDRTSKALVATLAKADVKDRLAKLGLIGTGLPSADLARIQRATQDTWAPTIKESGFVME